MNSRVPPTLIHTEDLNQIRAEAEKLGLPTSEIVRRKLMKPALDEEIILLRQLRELLLKKK